ncbi:light-harvesting complex-like protein 3 isotype 1, chloroplastic [Aristolochia californica]|uniref:light-harvesting complex-like protein 3 isotype 1, chloroplastic n=1 Tax=Aristolochia californica TaxID=171875 RepID=UPI0035DB26FD
MASSTIFVSIQSFHRVTKKPESPARPGRSQGAKQANHSDAQKLIDGTQKPVKLSISGSGSEVEEEARRRKFLQTYPQPATHESPVLFRSCTIPWWAWLRRFHLPEAEVLNGRAAMVGFFMAYFVDALSGIGLVDQTGNSICKAGLLAVVAGVLLFRQTENFGNIRSLTEEAILYDQQWRATYEDNNSEVDEGRST